MARYSVWAMLRVIFNVWQWHPPLWPMLASADRSQLPVPSHVTSLPVTPPRGSENSFPPGITSLEMWGNTVVEFGKFKGSRNQHQLTTLNECVHTGWLHTRSPLQIKTWLERQCTRWRISSVQTVEHQSTQAAHQFTRLNRTSVRAHRRHISTQGGTSVHKVAHDLIDWLTGVYQRPWHHWIKHPLTDWNWMNKRFKF